MSKWFIGIMVIGLVVLTTTVSAETDVELKNVIELKNVTIEPTEGYPPLTVYITSEICNYGTSVEQCNLILTIDSKDCDSYIIVIEPKTCEYFTLTYTFTEEGVYDIAIAVTCGDKLQDYYNTTITVLELDEDHDGWDDYVEQLIHKYYPEFDPVNETPTKDDVVQAIINAVKQYKTTPDLEQKMQIREDVRAIIKEYREELRKG